MKILYVDCKMGAAGDMLTAALMELLSDSERALFTVKMNRLGLKGVSFMDNRSKKCGITGTHVRVIVNGQEENEHMHEHQHSHGGDDHHHSHDGSGAHHEHSSLHNIEHLVYDHLNIPENVKKDVMNVYSIIAEAESKVHASTISDIHFHEVGTMDAVCDVTAVCLLMDMIKADKIVVSPIHVGSGTVKCAHGILPVPAPATALILEGIPTYSENIKGELCTPTGAALLKYFADEFANQPLMTVSKIGYGMGNKDFEVANCVRMLLGESFEPGNSNNSDDSSYTDNTASEIVELDFNVDDMTGEEIGFATGQLLENGAVEVFTTAVSMKKNRPGILFTVISRMEDEERLVESIFRYTTTLGIRKRSLNRYILHRRIETIDSPYGEVRKKISEGYGVIREKLEFDDIAMIAKRENKSLRDIKSLLQ